ncbi:hypothetical protein BKA93DRAFT_714620, partial [Sparassis latifolia]
QLTERLKKWFENGAVSGFGDAQETKVHANVRDAREIPASEFSVSPNLIEQVEKCWGDHVVSGSVRVEPYEIHVYGPGGQLKAHRDTSETNLVGTFLVGLGDTTKKGRLFIGEQIYNPVEYDGHKATPGSWIALHPNVKHKVAKIQDGYRAVIAFKLFCKEKDGMRTSVVRKKMENILERMQAPYSLLLAHEYCTGTTVLSSLDNILNEATHTIALKNLNSHFLPVLTKVRAKAYFVDDMNEVVADAKVYPFTQAHVELLLKKVKQKASTRSNSAETEWLVNATDIPFYSVAFYKTAVTWTHGVEEEGVEYTGNAVKPYYAERGIYFSYAMVVLPDAARTE